MEIYHTIADYPGVDSNDFYTDLYRKKEFNELKEITTGVYFSHQKIIARFLSHWTLYDGLLLVHDTGTGKSGSATAVYENLRRRSPVQVMYVTSNETLIDNFKNEIVRRSPSLRDAILEDTKDNDMDSDLFRRARNRVLAKENFHFFTYQTLASSIKKQEVPKEISNLLVIMDEVHHLVIQDIGKKDSAYHTLLSWLKAIPRKRVLLLTATPMRNDPSEVAPILNLILPKQEQLPIGKEFEDTFFRVKGTNANIPLLEWKKGMEDVFSSHIKGYVSVVKQNTDVRISYMGKVLPPMKHYRLYPNYMGTDQTTGYLKAWEQDHKNSQGETSFYSKAQQASLCVFPNGLYGLAGSRKYIDKNQRLTPEFLKLTGLKIGSEYDEQNLEIIAKYSATYASVIQYIIENPTEHIYVYCDKVNGSGIVMCIALLNTLFQFTVFKGRRMDWKQPRRRCMLLNEVQENVKEQNFQNMINIFNDERNLFAEYVQVVFGTDKTKEGISLKRIRQIHVTTPDWNFGKIFQAIGRGVRLLSHQDLDEEDRDVRIFFHCAIPATKKLNTSIDFYRYQRSELRDQNIKLVEYHLLTSAFDCQLNKTLNSRDQYKDFSPECYYQSCKYTCQGFDNIFPEELPIDYSTFDSFYIMGTIRHSIHRIQNCFSERPIWSFGELCKELSETPRVVFEALMTMVDTPLPMVYRGVQLCYLSRNKDMFFLIDDVTLPQPQSPMMTYYAMNPSFSVGIGFDGVQQQLREQGNTILKIIKTIVQLVTRPGDHSEHIQKLLQIIPLSWQQDVLLTWLLTEPVPHPFTDALRSFFKTKANLAKGIHYLFPKPMRFDPLSNTWVVGDTILEKKQDTVDHSDPTFVERYITDNPYKLYAYYTQDKPDSLKIRDITDPGKISTKDKKNETHGKHCFSYKLKELMYFFYIMGGQNMTPTNSDPLYSRYKESMTMSDKEVSKSVNPSKTFQELLTMLGYKTATPSITRFFFVYEKATKEYFCQQLTKLFQDKDLIVLPPLKKKQK